jgi:hypothetical protein
MILNERSERAKRAGKGFEVEKRERSERFAWFKSLTEHDSERTE